MLAHPILALPCVCENVKGSHSLAVPWIKRNSTNPLVNSAKLGRQGTKMLVHILINYTIYDAILECFSCLPLDISVINCMRNPTQLFLHSQLLGRLHLSPMPFYFSVPAHLKKHENHIRYLISMILK